jgi:N-acetylmuramoyl-L-alanine amidase
VRLLAGVLVLAAAAQLFAATTVLERVEVIESGGPAVRLHLSAPAAAHTGALAAGGGAPQRVYVDLAGAVLDTRAPAIVPGVGPLLRVRTGQFDARTARVVLDLSGPLPYRVRDTGRTIVIELGTSSEAAPSAEPPPPAPAATPPPAELPPTAAPTPRSEVAPPAEAPAETARVEPPPPPPARVEPPPTPPPARVEPPPPTSLPARDPFMPPADVRLALRPVEPLPSVRVPPTAGATVETRTVTSAATPGAPDAPVPRPAVGIPPAPGDAIIVARRPAPPPETGSRRAEATVPATPRAPLPPTPVDATIPRSPGSETQTATSAPTPGSSPLAAAPPLPAAPERVAPAALLAAAERARQARERATQRPAPPAVVVTPKPAPPPPALNTPSRAPAVSGPRAVIVVDAGHGGRDPGAAGVGGVLEKDVALAAARVLARRLAERLPVTVVMTRTDDSYLPIDDRIAVSTEGAALFISLHANACNDPGARGFEIFYGGGAVRDASTGAGSSRAALLGRCLSRALQAQIGRVRGDARPGAFGILSRNPLPSALVEIGYLTHPDDAAWTQNAAAQEALASALVEGVAAFLRASAPPL